MPVPAVSAWRTQIMRVTAFLQYNDRGREETWWQTALQEDAEARVQRPKEGVFEDEGPYEGGRLKLAIRPGRADWIWFLSPLSFDPRSNEIPSLGTFDEAWGKCQQIIRAWMSARPVFTRLALGVILDQQVADRAAGYALLQEYLPKVDLDPASSDFIYQINRPKESKTLSGYRINRLSKWAALQASFVEVAVDPAQLQRKDMSVIRLDMDVNSYFDANIPIPADRVLPLMEELAANARGLAEKGDVP